MNLRLHEIETGTNRVAENTAFFQNILGLQPSLQQEELTVFDSGLQGLNFNLSTHFPQGNFCVSFLTDDLAEMEKKLRAANVMYESPLPSHLGMNSIRFKSLDGHGIKVNAPTAASPD